MARFASALTRHVPPWALLALMLTLTAHVSRAQTVPGTSPAPAAQEVPKDPLGRTTPRGTVLGFLNAARKGDNALAREYLDTNLNGQRAETLAHQLFIVLDTRLPARLTELSDAPEGSRSYLLAPDQDLIGRITGDHDTVDILVTRVERGKYGPIWLFSSKTLAAIPSLYQEVSESQEATTFDRFLGAARGSAKGRLVRASLLRRRFLPRPIPTHDFG